MSYYIQNVKVILIAPFWLDSQVLLRWILELYSSSVSSSSSLYIFFTWLQFSISLNNSILLSLWYPPLHRFWYHVVFLAFLYLWTFFLIRYARMCDNCSCRKVHIFMCCHVSVCVAMYLYVLACICMCWHVSVCVAMYLYVLPCICMCWHVSVCVGMYLYVLPCICMCCHVSVCVAM